ncbi:hypothetical protein WN51_13422 [Melipona quadrifasciata]|uniref:Uncharacterized protein n=1 Tax=Melipona quadrifasciata TaxID=166423 RepID=A0A0M9A0Y1_9HYME|nr:hypothetical protein WN51_13422 [Melipona quadrifasciata]
MKTLSKIGVVEHSLEHVPIVLLLDEVAYNQQISFCIAQGLSLDETNVRASVTTDQLTTVSDLERSVKFARRRWHCIELLIEFRMIARTKSNNMSEKRNTYDMDVFSIKNLTTWKTSNKAPHRSLLFTTTS